MDYGAVKKKWACEYLKSNQLTRKIQEQNLHGFLRRLQWFLCEKNWINVIEDRESQFHSWSRHVSQILTYLMPFNPSGEKNLLLT